MKKHAAALALLTTGLLLTPSTAHATVQPADLPTSSEVKALGLLTDPGSSYREKTLEVPALRSCEASVRIPARGWTTTYSRDTTDFLPLAVVSVQDARSVAKAKLAIKRHATFARRCPVIHDSDGSTVRIRSLRPLPGGRQRFALRMRVRAAGGPAMTGRLYGFRQGKRVVQVAVIGTNSTKLSRATERRLVRLALRKAF